MTTTTHKHSEELLGRPGWVRLAVLTPVGLALAGAALVHAAAENGAVQMAMADQMRATLNAEIHNRLVEREFRTTSVQATETGVNFVPMPEAMLQHARDTYGLDPLKMETLRSIALGAVQHTDPDKARTLMETATRISRRDPMTNMWLVGEYARTGDLPALLDSFDRALRTSGRVREAAMAPLVNILAQPESHKLLGGLLARDPEWKPDFWAEFAHNDVALDNAEAFFADSGVSFADVPDDTRRAIYSNLKKSRRFATLFHLAALDPSAGMQRQLSADQGFEVASGGSPFGWELESTGNYSALVNRGTGHLEIDARPGSFGTAANRLMPVSGSYRMGIKLAEPMPANAGIDLNVRCLDESGAQLARVTVAAGASEGQTVFASGACAFASIDLTFNVEQGRRDAVIRVESITLQSN